MDCLIKICTNIKGESCILSWIRLVRILIILSGSKQKYSVILEDKNSHKNHITKVRIRRIWSFAVDRNGINLGCGVTSMAHRGSNLGINELRRDREGIRTKAFLEREGRVGSTNWYGWRQRRMSHWIQSLITMLFSIFNLASSPFVYIWSKGSDLIFKIERLNFIYFREINLLIF